MEDRSGKQDQPPGGGEQGQGDDQEIGQDRIEGHLVEIVNDEAPYGQLGRGGGGHQQGGRLPKGGKFFHHPGGHHHQPRRGQERDLEGEVLDGERGQGQQDDGRGDQQ